MSDTIKEMFAILPYLKTSGLVKVRGIEFRSSNDLKGLSDQVQEHLRALFSMFFLRANHRIKEMVYSHLDFSSSSAEEFDDMLKRLRQAHILIGYLYSSPQPKSDRPALDLEHSSLYLFNTFRTSNVLLSPSEGVEDITGQPPLSFEEQHKWVEGYAGLVNWNSHIWVAQGSRIFPSDVNFSLHPHQDLLSNLGELAEIKHNWAIEELIKSEGESPNPLEPRLFTAIEWHNRSYSRDITEELALVFLAIAFESLLNLEQGEELSKRFKESVITLLGPIPRLDSWLDQFYNARSAIVHRGYWPHLRFYAVDKKVVSKVYNPEKVGIDKEQVIVHRSLTSYGRRIFRACLNAILSGSQLAHKTQISTSLVHNQQRLEMMCKSLDEDRIPPAQRIRSVRRDVIECNNSWIEAEGYVKGESVLAVAKRLAQAYVDTSPSIPEEAISLLKDAIGASTGERYEKFDKYLEFSSHIRNWRGNRLEWQLEASDDPLDILLFFITYMFHHKFINK
jgi:hypothetical protein